MRGPFCIFLATIFVLSLSDFARGNSASVEFSSALQEFSDKVSCGAANSDLPGQLSKSIPTIAASLNCEVLAQFKLLRSTSDDAPSEISLDRATDAIWKLTVKGNNNPGSLQETVSGLEQGKIQKGLGLTVIPPKFCNDLSVPEASCEVPTCLVPLSSSSNADDTSGLCATEDDVSMQRDLAAKIKTVAKNWNLDCSADSDRVCLPVDQTSVIARSYLTGPGLAIIREIQVSKDAGKPIQSKAAVSALVEADTACRRAVQTAIAIGGLLSSYSTDFGIAEKGKSIEDARSETFGVFGPLIWFSKAPCENDASLKLMNLVREALRRIPHGTQTSTLIVENVKASGCDAVTSLGSINFIDFKTKNAAQAILRLKFDKPFVVMPDPGLDPTDRARGASAQLYLMTPLSESASRATDPLLCDAGFLVASLGIKLSNLIVENGQVVKRDIIGQATSHIEPEIFAGAIKKLFDVEPVQLTIGNVEVPQSIVPVKIPIELSLPGLDTLGLGSFGQVEMNIDPNRDELGLGEFTREKMGQKINGFLAGKTIDTAGLHIAKISLDQNAFRDSRTVRLNAAASSRAISSLFQGGEMPVTLIVKADGSSIFEADALGSTIEQGVRSIVLNEANTVLKAVIPSFASDFERHIAVEQLRFENNEFRATISTTAADGSRTEIPFIMGQTDNILDVAKRILSKSDVKQKLLEEAKQYAARQVANAAGRALLKRDRIVAALKGGLKLFGLTFAVDEIATGSDVRFSLISSDPAFAIRGVRVKASFQDGKDLIAAADLDLSDASLHGNLGTWLESKLPSGGYVKLRVSEPSLLAGKLHIPVVASMPGVRPLALSLDLGDTNSSINELLGQIRNQLLQEIASRLGKNLAGTALEVAGVTAQITGVKIDNQSINLEAVANLHDVFNCFVKMEIYPSQKLLPPNCDPIGGALSKLLDLPLGGISHIEIKTNPLEVAFDVSFSQLFDTGYLPTIRLTVPAKGPIRISDPITIQLPLDFTVGVFAFANPAIEIFVNQNQKFGLRGDFTFVARPVAYVIRVAAHIVGNLQSKQLDLDGGIYLLTFLELFDVNGHMEFGPKNFAEGTAEAGSAIRSFLKAEANIRMDADVCRITQKSTMKLLGMSADGSFIVQIKGLGCKSSPEIECTPIGGSSGAVCLRGNIDLLLGRASASAEFPLALKLPRVSAQVSALGTNIDIRASSAFVKASFSVFGIKLGVMVPSFDKLTPKLIEQIIENALKPSFNLKLTKQIIISPYKGDSDGDPGEKGRSSSDGGSEGDDAAEGSQPGPVSPPSSTSTQTGKSEQAGWQPGEWTISFLESTSPTGFFRRRWTGPGGKTVDDSWLISSSKTQILRDAEVLAYNGYAISSFARERDANGFNRSVAYQVIFSPPGRYCSTGVCAFKMGINESARTVADVGSQQMLAAVAEGSPNPVDYFKSKRNTLKEQQMQALQHLSLLAFEPDNYGTSNRLECFKDNPHGTPCDIVVVIKTLKSGARTRRIFTGSRPNGVEVEEGSFVTWALDNGLMETVQSALSRGLSTLVVAEDETSFLLQNTNLASRESSIAILDKANHRNSLVGAMVGDLFAGTDAKSTLIKQPEGLADGVISMARERSQDTGARLLYRISPDGAKVLYQAASPDGETQTILMESSAESSHDRCRWDGLKQGMKSRLDIAPAPIREAFDADPWVVALALAGDRQAWLSSGWTSSPTQLLDPSPNTKCVK